jgi:UDP-3-O-[3-hydroxymyristoyl] glucosamine N-acyltransferase
LNVEEKSVAEYLAKELAEITGSKLVGPNSNLWITGINTLEEAGPHDISFLANERYIEMMKKSKAGVICIDKKMAYENSKNYFLCDDPSFTFQKIAEIFLSSKKSESAFSGIHPTAVVHPTCKIGQNVTIGPFAVIDQNVTIGDGTSILSLVSIGPDVQIGKDCILYPSCVVRENCILKDRVILQPGAVIGSCGFGYLPDQDGSFRKLAQMGNVLLEEDVEIGANTTIDRARFKSTIIGKGSKIDNLVQIAHNVEIGPHNGIAAQTGIAGSSKTKSHVIMGGQVGVTGHVEITDGVMLATRSGVSKSMLKPGKYRGSPAIDLNDYNRREVHIRKLPEYVQMIQELTKKVQELENKLTP